MGTESPSRCLPFLFGEKDLLFCKERVAPIYRTRATHYTLATCQAGVHLVTCPQGKIDWSDFASRIVYGVQQEAKHAYLRDLSRNATRGLIARAMRGEWVAGGNPPMGYALRNHRPALGDSAVVELIRRIYREYLAGGSLQGLAKQLN